MSMVIMGVGPGATAIRPTKPAAPPPRKYAYSKKFFEKSIRDAVHESIFSPVSLGEKHHVSLKPKFDTACWAFLPPHRIYIGTELFEKPMVKVGLTDEQQAKYIANHYHHELGHALFTERDMKRIQRSLKTMDCPFNLYNLFEDAYMEDRYRREADYRFEWLTLETLDFNPRAESLLFALIQAEGDVTVVETAVASWKPKAPEVDASDPLSMLASMFAQDPADTLETLQALLPRVIDYYRKIVAVKESMHLMPLLKAWLDEFGRPPPMGNSGPGGGRGDMQHSSDLMTGEVSVEEFEAEVEELNPSDDSDEKGGGVKGKADAVDNHNAVCKKGNVLGYTEWQLDMSRVDALANKFKKFFTEKSRVVSTRTPQRRMSARHFALDRAPYRKTEVEGRGAKRVFLEIDCSGSMSGFHISEGRILVMALSILARQGYLEGHVALSGTSGGESHWELYALPMAKEVIARIDGNMGGEGLAYTLNAHIKLLQDADFVFVYTDGQITDKPIDKSHFHRYGVYTWGLYAGNSQGFLPKLMKYFDKAIMRDNAEALVDAMLIQQK